MVRARAFWILVPAAALSMALFAGGGAATHAQAPGRTPPSPSVQVAIAGRIFDLEIALDRLSRHRGLGGRSAIAPYGGMLFSWKQPRQLSMVMRDCAIPIDVAFLDSRGRVVALHAMTPESPRGEDETPFVYESRLRVYSSGKPAQHAVELSGGRLEELGVGIGDQFVADWVVLAARVR